MNRNRKGVMPEITREMYKSIKEVDHDRAEDAGNK